MNVWEPATFLSGERGRPFIIRLLSLPAAALALFFFPCPADLAEAGLSVLEKSEQAVGRTVGNYRLVDQNGRHVPFYSFRGKPVLLSFMYIDCPDMCILTNQSLKHFLTTLNTGLAKKVILVSVSIDPENDTPKKLREYGSEFSDDFSKWLFTTADSETLTKMITDLGFSYERKAEGEIEHLSRVTLIGSDGVVARHFYGARLDTQEIEESVRAVIEGQPLSSMLSGTLSKILIYCSTYDPVSKTYKVDYSFLFIIFLNYLLIMATVIYLLRFKIKKLLFKK